MRYLSISEVVRLHFAIMDAIGGGKGIRDLGSLESCLAQPRSTFGGTELYPSLIEKAGSLCFSLARNHPFIDGNKRIAHAAMETFLILNGHEIHATVDEQEQLMLGLAQSSVSREELVSPIVEYRLRGFGHESVQEVFEGGFGGRVGVERQGELILRSSEPCCA